MKFNAIAFLFPGQGSQYPGMGKDFFENFPSAREVFEEADDILHRPLSKVVFDGPIDTLTETHNSQTGIYVTSLALLRVLETQFPNLKPQVCAGLSLGEYSALTATGRLSFQQGLPLVQFRGEYMHEACERTKGTMAAILGLPVEVVEQLVQEASLPNDLWIANYNSPLQTVISGTLKGVQIGTELAKSKGAKRVLSLQVHGAFHSGLMKLAEEKLREKIHQIALSASSIDIVMNVPGDYVSDLSKMRSHMISQVTSPVRWQQGIKQMSTVDLFVEIGCGKALAGMNKQNEVLVPTFSINKISDLEELAQRIT